MIDDGFCSWLRVAEGRKERDIRQAHAIKQISTTALPCSYSGSAQRRRWAVPVRVLIQ